MNFWIGNLNFAHPVVSSIITSALLFFLSFFFFFVIAGASNTFSSLGKRIRHSFREKRRSLRLSVDGAHGCNTSTHNCEGCKQVKSECQNVFRLQGGWFRVWFLMAAGDLSLLQSIQASTGTHPTSFTLDTRNPVRGHKVAKSSTAAEIKNEWNYAFMGWTETSLPLYG